MRRTGRATKDKSKGKEAPKPKGKEATAARNKVLKGISVIEIPPKMTLDKAPEHYNVTNKYFTWKRGKYSAQCDKSFTEHVFGKTSTFGKTFVKYGGNSADLIQADEQVFRAKTPLSTKDWEKLYLKAKENPTCKTFLFEYEKEHNKYREKFVTKTLAAMKNFADAKKRNVDQDCDVVAKDSFSFNTQWIITLRDMSKKLSIFIKPLVKGGKDCIIAALQENSMLCFFRSLDAEMYRECKLMGFDKNKNKKTDKANDKKKKKGRREIDILDI